MCPVEKVFEKQTMLSEVSTLFGPHIVLFIFSHIILNVVDSVYVHERNHHCVPSKSLMHHPPNLPKLWSDHKKHISAHVQVKKKKKKHATKVSLQTAEYVTYHSLLQESIFLTLNKRSSAPWCMYKNITDLDLLRTSSQKRQIVKKRIGRSKKLLYFITGLRKPKGISRYNCIKGSPLLKVESSVFEWLGIWSVKEGGRGLKVWSPITYHTWANKDIDVMQDKYERVWTQFKTTYKPMCSLKHTKTQTNKNNASWHNDMTEWRGRACLVTSPTGLTIWPTYAMTFWSLFDP